MQNKSENSSGTTDPVQVFKSVNDDELYENLAEYHKFALTYFDKARILAENGDKSEASKYYTVTIRALYHCFKIGVKNKINENFKHEIVKDLKTAVEAIENIGY